MPRGLLGRSVTTLLVKVMVEIRLRLEGAGKMMICPMDAVWYTPRTGNNANIRTLSLGAGL